MDHFVIWVICYHMQTGSSVLVMNGTCEVTNCPDGYMCDQDMLQCIERKQLQYQDDEPDDRTQYQSHYVIPLAYLSGFTAAWIIMLLFDFCLDMAKLLRPRTIRSNNLRVNSPNVFSFDVSLLEDNEVKEHSDNIHSQSFKHVVNNDLLPIPESDRGYIDESLACGVGDIVIDANMLSPSQSAYHNASNGSELDSTTYRSASVQNGASRSASLESLDSTSALRNGYDQKGDRDSPGAATSASDIAFADSGSNDLSIPESNGGSSQSNRFRFPPALRIFSRKCQSALISMVSSSSSASGGDTPEQASSMLNSDPTLAIPDEFRQPIHKSGSDSGRSGSLGPPQEEIERQNVHQGNQRLYQILHGMRKTSWVHHFESTGDIITIYTDLSVNDEDTYLRELEQQTGEQIDHFYIRDITEIDQ